MEQKFGNEKTSRELFERFTNLVLPQKKMKGLFVKFLNFEKGLIGGPGRSSGKMVEKVKQKAMEYVNRATGGDGEGGDEDGDGEGEGEGEREGEEEIEV